MKVHWRGKGFVDTTAATSIEERVDKVVITKLDARTIKPCFERVLQAKYRLQLPH